MRRDVAGRYPTIWLQSGCTRGGTGPWAPNRLERKGVPARDRRPKGAWRLALDSQTAEFTGAGNTGRRYDPAGGRSPWRHAKR